MNTGRRGKTSATKMRQTSLLSTGKLDHLSGAVHVFLQQKWVSHQCPQSESSSNLLLPPSVHAQTLRLCGQCKERQKNEQTQWENDFMLHSGPCNNVILCIKRRMKVITLIIFLLILFAIIWKFTQTPWQDMLKPSNHETINCKIHISSWLKINLKISHTL